MRSSPPTQPPQSPDRLPDLDEELRKYGITRVRVEYFEVNGYRYSTVRDAIAESKRHNASAAADPHARSSTDVEGYQE